MFVYIPLRFIAHFVTGTNFIYCYLKISRWKTWREETTWKI